MVNATYADSGSIYSCYWCETCEIWMQRYGEYGDEYGYSDLRYVDEWQEIHQEIKATPYVEQ